MLGAIVGDIVSSSRHFRDATVATLAVAEWLMTDSDHTVETLVASVQRLRSKYSIRGFCKCPAIGVSPVGLYANSLEEALELAYIVASALNPSSKSIKDAQTMAGCVYLKRNTDLGENERIRQFVTQKMGYNLDLNSCEYSRRDSVLVAIKVYLEHCLAKEVLEFAISIRKDFDSIASMASAIAATERQNVCGGGFRTDLIEDCRIVLPADLLDINDRFEAFISRPLYQSYYLNEYLYAGEYLGDKDEEVAKRKIKQMLHFGVKHFVDLTEEGELRPYSHILPKGISYLRFPIKDCGVPQSFESVNRLLDKIQKLQKMGGYTYIHCWGGVGRTGTIVGCLKARQLYKYDDFDALTVLRNFYKEMPKSTYHSVPDTQEQEVFIETFARNAKDYAETAKSVTKDSIKGCLIGMAIGEAIGLSVKSMNYKEILDRFGENGIERFQTNIFGKVSIGLKSQIVLSSAFGLLRSVTRGNMRGIGGAPENSICGDERDSKRNTDCCKGIVWSMPIALLSAGYAARGERFYSIPEMSSAATMVAQSYITNPLDFLPAAMLAYLLYSLIPMSADTASEEFEQIVQEAIDSLDYVFPSEFDDAKQHLAQLTEKAVVLTKNESSDVENIQCLGMGKTAADAWAIALYCTLRYKDNMQNAIAASVNHDGDSDSIGFICGSIMGAIYGYEAVNRQCLFCPKGKDFENVFKYSDSLLNIADDLYTSCIISEFEPIDTPEKQRWYKRYCSKCL